MAVACATNFAIVTSPCHGFADDTLPSMPAGDALLLAALLPEKEEEIADMGGTARVAVVSPFSWTASSSGGYWRSPEIPPAPAAGLEQAWSFSAPVEQPLPAETDPLPPWQPAPLPAGTDPAPPAGVFGVLPIEQQAGTAVILGEVSDATTLDPIPGAIVDVIGTGRTVETDGQGKFRIDGLPAGDFTAEASALNYSPEVLGVSPNPSGPVQLRFSLRQKPAESGSEEYVLEEESIVGEYQESRGGDLFIDLQAGPNITAGISKEEFTKTGVSDAGDAVSKISGANIVGGKYAVVRGLGDRYSNTLVNGALISSADPSKKAIQLDLFPSDLLQSVAINKTFTPDLPAEFAGGTVLIETLRFPEERIIEFEYGTSWNSELDGQDMRTVPGRDLDFWGTASDGLPPAAGSTEKGLPVGHSGSRPPSSATQREAAAKAAAAWAKVHSSAGMRSGTRDVRPGESLDLTIGDTFKPIGDLEIGAVFAFTHSKEDSVRDNVQIGRNLNPGLDLKPGTPDDYFNRTQTEDRYTSSVKWGGLGSLGFKLGEKHKVGLTWFRNHSAEDQVTIGDNQTDLSDDIPEYLPAERNPWGAGAYTTYGFENIVPLQRDLEVFQLDGSHQIGEEHRGPRIDWMISSSDALEDRPHSRTLYYSQLDFTDPRIQSEQGDIYNPGLGRTETFADVHASGTPSLQSFRESLSTQEESDNERIDLTLPAYHREDSHFLEFKLGANRFDRSREVRGRLFIYQIGGGLNEWLLGNGGQNGVDYLDGFDSVRSPGGDSKFGGWSGTNAATRGDDLILSEATKIGRTVRNVDAGSEVISTYLMGTFNHGPWTIVGGARAEKESRSYQVLPGLNSPAFANDAPVEQEEDSLLPGVTLTRDFGRENQFTTSLAWSRTIARPTFYEFAPVITEDQSTGDVIEGNPDLKDTFISNFDLRVEWNPEPGAAMAVGLFHKSMTDPIAQAYNLNKKTWVNGDQGTLQGIELEVRKRFLEHWNITSNFTLIDSLLEYQQQVGTSGIQTITTTYEGQPDHIFNFIFGYDHQPTGWSANLIYNYTGSYLTGVPLTDTTPAIRRDAYHSLDLVLMKRFDLRECVGTVKLKLGNLLDGTDTERVEDSELIYRSYKPGRSASLSFEVEF